MVISTKQFTCMPSRQAVSEQMAEKYSQHWTGTVPMRLWTLTLTGRWMSQERKKGHSRHDIKHLQRRQKSEDLDIKPSESLDEFSVHIVQCEHVYQFALQSYTQYTIKFLMILC